MKNMNQTFTEYLQEYVARNFPHTDDTLPDVFEDWLEDVDKDKLIELAQKWGESLK